MFVEFSIRPVKQPPLEQNLASHAQPQDRVPSHPRPPSLSACLEGSWDEVMPVIRGWQQALANAQPRVVTTIVIVEDHAEERKKNWPHCLHDAIPAGHSPAGDAGRSVRRIPISA